MANSVVSFDIDARKIDFVSQFGTEFKGLMDLMAVSRPIFKESGTDISIKKVSIDLADQVAKGQTIALTDAEVTEVDADPITINKYRKATTLEDISRYGYDNAVERTDDGLRRAIGSAITSGLYATLMTGTLTGSESTFQMALAIAHAKVSTQFNTISLGVTGTVGFVNTTDFYTYLGGAEISVQSAFGMDYVQNFMGYDVVFISPFVTQGKVAATALNNLNIYAVNPSDSDFTKSGLEFVTDDTGLIGVQITPNYSNATSETYAICGVKLLPEFIDGVSVITVTP